MSIDIGSAHGSIELKTDGVLTSVRAAGAALRQFDRDSAGVGKNLSQMGREGEAAGKAVEGAAKSASNSVKSLGEVAGQAAQGFSKVSTAATLAGTAIIAGLGAAAKQAASLETAVTKISTIAPEIDTHQVESQLSGMSTRIAQSSTQLAESLNTIFSSIETNQADALKLTEQFGKGAIAASTDADTFGTAVLGVMNAYGLSVSDASHISDVFFNTINKGVVSGDQLAHGLGQVTQAAKLAGVDFDTLGALIAGVTREGGDASTNINNLQNALSKISTPDAQNALKEIGVSTKDANGNIRNMVDILTDLKSKLDALSPAARSEALRKIFPDQQALAGISTLLNQLPTINESLTLNAKSAGSASAAYEKMGKTAEAQAQLLKNTFAATLQELGTAVLPDALAIVTKLRDMLAAFNDLSPSTQGVIIHFAEFTAVSLLLVGALGKVITFATTAAQSFQALSAATTAMGGLSAVATVAGPAIIAVGLAAAGTAITMHEMAKGTKEAADAIGGPLATAIQKVNVSGTDGLLAFLTGFSVGADKARQATNDWVNGLEGTAPTLAQLHTQLEVTAAAYKRVVDAGGANSPQAVTLAAITDALFQQIAAWEKLNSEQGIRDRMLTSEAEAEQVATAAAREHAEALARVQAALTEMNGQQQKVPFTGGGALAQGALGIGQASQELTRNLQEYVAAAGDAIAVDAAQTAEKLRLTNALAAQQSALGNVQSAIAPLSAAMAQLAAKQAEGIPLTQAEQALWSQSADVLGAAQSATQGLTLASAQNALALINASGGITAFAGAAASSTGAIDKLRGIILSLNEAFGALGSQDAQLTAFAGKFQARIDVLEASKKAGTITPEEVGELQHLLDLQAKIGDQLAINAAKEREIAENILAANEAKKAQEVITQNAAARAAADAGNEIAVDPASLAAVKAIVDKPVPVNLEPAVDNASLAAVRAILSEPVKIPVTVEPSLVKTGLDSATAEAMGIIGTGGGAGATQTVTINATDNASPILNNVKTLAATVGALVSDVKLTATDNASTKVGILFGNIDNLPDDHSTTLTAIDNASNIVQNLINTINNIPQTFNITANVDTSGALAAIANLRANMPSSPAEKGPFRTLPDWSSVFASLGPAGDDAIKTVEKTVQAMGEGIASGIGKIDTEGAKSAAEFASSIASAVTATVGATEALARLRTPNAGKITQLRDTIQAIMSAFAGVAGEPSSDDAKKAAQEWNDNASSILSLVSTGVDALTKLGTFERPTDQAVKSFRDVAQFVVNVMSQVAADTSLQAVVAAGVWADGAGKIFQALGTGVDALSKLGDFERPTDQAVRSFRDVAQFLVNLFAQVAADSEAGPVADAGIWADNAIKIMTLVGSGVDALTKLGEFERPTDQAVRSFRDVAQFFVNLIVQLAADSDTKGVAAAATYAENATKIVGLVGAGVTAFKSLAEDDFVLPSQEKLQQLATATRLAVIAIQEASADLDTKGVAAAGTYADAASKVVGLIGAGIAGFKDFSDFQPPSAQQIQQLKSVISATVIAIAQAAKEINADAVKAAGEYAEGAGSAIGLVGQTISSFAHLDDFVAPSKEAIANVVAVTGYAVQQLAGIAASFDKAQLAKLKEFGESAGAGFGAIGSALNAGKALEGDHVSPADAIGKVLAEFQAGLGPLGALAAISEQYKTQGNIISANIAQAYASIAGSIPGFTPQSTNVAATVTGTNVQTVAHVFSGGINISFLGENGTWVVKSLQADNASLQTVSDMIATEIAADFAAVGAGSGAKGMGA